jgi:cellulose biosynthesis protein BcsQ
LKTLGFLNPKAGAGQSRLIFNLGWVLADAGFRVGLIDFDPQAGLTELAGALPEARGSVYGALAPLLETASDLETPEAVQLEANLWLIRGHIQASIFDDALATAWTPAAEPRAQALVQGIGRMIETIAEQSELDVVLCDLCSSLGPLCHAVSAAVDAIVVPLAPRAIEGAVLRSLAYALRRWREAPSHDGRPDPFRTLGFVIVRPSGVIELGLDHVVAAYHRELSGEHLGTIKNFPSLASIARSANRPEIQLSMADGAIGSLSSAVVDLRNQYEVLATQLVNVSSLLDEVALAMDVEQVLESALRNDLPSELDQLSSRIIIDEVANIALEIPEIRRGGLRILGSASVHVRLEWGGGERRDGTEASKAFPLRFDLELNRSHESAMVVHRIEADTSSFYA